MLENEESMVLHVDLLWEEKTAALVRREGFAQLNLSQLPLFFPLLAQFTALLK